jgi:hypothetical protein
MDEKNSGRNRPAGTAAAQGRPSPAVPDGDTVQGEGDHDSARRYNADQQQFVASHDVEALARQAAPRSELEAAVLARAEARGGERSKGDAQNDQAPRRRGRFLRRKR